VKCHGADGAGSPARGRGPNIPDFTDASWQARRSDAQLLASILDGKGPDMPTWRGKMSEGQARGLVAFVRAFAPPPEGPGREEPEKPAPDRFGERYRRLQKQLDELTRRFRELSRAFPETPPRPSAAPRSGLPRLRGQLAELLLQALHLHV
jgi:hypothetical protein